ncbi:hypothetical protein [Sporolituus thermophilus]|uniref:Uncharacterized protein n=1 Tax=Sporolituus thermophilus DSM 23256 TaxID=1123285 RepID=A0A1G7MI88_9FIRM|nr:hypothetical protein [Sporolituus thermophilus]SDF61394.1 hypothetical protein SAMN05660235_02175 [Sporolituus thermophilus DSM 23256]
MNLFNQINQKKLLLIALLCLLFLTNFVYANPTTDEYNFNFKFNQQDDTRPKVVFLPIVDRSGLHKKYSTAAIETINERVEKQFSADKFILLKGEKIDKTVKEFPFENYDAPVLNELIALGKKFDADYIMFFSLEPIKAGASGFGIGVGAGKIKIDLAMKAKYVDVKKGEYVFNQVLAEQGSSSAVTIGIFGGVSPKHATVEATNKCMDKFFAGIAGIYKINP